MLQLREQLRSVDLEVLQVDIRSELGNNALAVLNRGELDELVRRQTRRARDDRAKDGRSVSGGLRHLRDWEGETDIDSIVLQSVQRCHDRATLLRLEAESLEGGIEREQHARSGQRGVAA